MTMVRSLLVAIFLLWAPATVGDNAVTLRMATTTSTDNSGLLAVLLPEFQKETGIKVHVIAVGTGKALRMGRDGDVDLVLVHAPGAEKRFVEAGFGIDRRDLMYNDFIIVGPERDPGDISSSTDASEALRKVANSEALFISRGDDSGTHKKELNLWKSAGISPSGNWYREAGQGMGKVLQIAGELGAYTLTDRGTWLAYRDKSPLTIRFQGDPRLFNPYGVIAVNPARYPDINYAGATHLISWLTSSRGQELIGDFTISGQHLFTPSADASQLAVQQ